MTLFPPPAGDDDAWVEVPRRSGRTRAADPRRDGSRALPRGPSRTRPGRLGAGAGGTRDAIPRRGPPRTL